LPVDYTISPVRDAQGAIDGATVAFTDVSERDAARAGQIETEIALEHERQRVFDVFRQAPSFMVVTRGPDHVIEQVNDAFIRLGGRSDMIGQAVADAFPEVAGQGFIKLLDGVFQTGEPYVGQATPVRLSSAAPERYVDFVYQPLSDPEGNRTGVFIQGFDVTERTAAEEHSRFQAKLLDTIAEAVIATDIEGRILYWNKAAERLYGWTAEEITGQNFLALFPTEIETGDAQRVVQTLQSGEEWSGDFPARRKDGSVFQAGASATAIRDANGNQIGVIGITVDLTEQKAIEAQLRQAQKLEAVGRLAGGIAHDFNNLLTVIQGNTDLLLHGVAPERLTNVEEIRDAAARAAELTKQLLAFSRQQVMQPRVISPAEVVRGMEDLLQRLLRTDIQLSVSYGDHVGMVRADPSQLSQVVMNLAANARDAMPDGGRLDIALQNVDIDGDEPTLRSLTPGRYVMLRVSDTGTGMDARTLALVFEPFFTTKGPDRGTGLGLATVFGIVAQSGGSVTAESDLGRGTTFRVYLPVAEPETDIEHATEPMPVVDSVRGGETILLCEDEEAVRRIVRMSLERQGYHVLDATSGQEALELAGGYDGPIHLLLSDVVMPQMGGPELMSRMRELRPGMKGLLMSGYARPEAGGEGVFEFDVPFLEKPFTIRQLSTKVRQVLG
ncbi:MAG TPA: PAS domain S-box protein, partial [Longimicrobiales bacterium]